MSNFITPCKGRITSPFGFRIHPIRNQKEMHWGVDYGNTPSDNTIVASADGTVERANVFGGYGNTIIITHNIKGVTYQTLYAHLSSMSVKVGAKIKQGQKIGVKGTTGNSTGIHLHFEVHKNGKRNSNYTHAVNPLEYVVDTETLDLQALLNKSGYKLTVDGISGAATTNAVKDFQKKNGLTADGIAGKITIEKLKSSLNKVASAEQPKKLMWGTVEFRPNQIGKITILKDINLWKDGNNKKLEMVRVLKKGEAYRVYGYRNEHGGQYDVGGMWITKMEGYIKYETPPKSLLKQAETLFK